MTATDLSAHTIHRAEGAPNSLRDRVFFPVPRNSSLGPDTDVLYDSRRSKPVGA